MTFLDTPGGSAVFSVRLIAESASIPYKGNDNVARISENVLRRFLDPETFSMPG